MYLTLYVFRVPDDRVARFLEIQDAASARYLHHGALEDVTLAAADIDAAYGCMGLVDAVPPEAGEQVFLGLARFRDLAHKDAVMAAVDTDPEIERLFAEISQVIDLSRVVRAEFAMPR